MSTFDELAVRNGVGCIYYFDVAPDPTATYPYTLRYSTQWFSNEDYPSSLDSQPRIASLGNLSRALGADRGLTASTISVTLENSDGGVDWIADRDTYATDAIGSEWRLTCLLYDQSARPFTDYNVKVLGVFTLMDPPTRTNGTIELQLVDQTLTKLDINTPTILDWCGVTDANRPFDEDEYRDILANGTRYTTSGEGVFPLDAPLPVAWGWAPVKPIYIAKNCYVVCCVPGAAGGLPVTVDAVFAGNGFVIPHTLESFSLAYAGDPMTVWTVRRSATITKNGKEWHFIWLDLDLTGDGYRVSTASGRGDSSLIWDYLQKQGGIDLSSAAIAGTRNTGTGATQNYSYLGYDAHRLVSPSILMRLLSHNANDLPEYGVRAATVIEDIITTCIDAALTVTGADATNTLRPSSFASDSIYRQFQTSKLAPFDVFQELTGGQTPTAIRQLCQLGQFDGFFKWDGSFGISALGADATSQSATLPSLAETLIESVTERIPSVGERNAPVNRVFITTKGSRFGPFDDADAMTAWGRPVVKEIDAQWLPGETRSTASGNFAYDGAVPFPLLGLISTNGMSTIRPVLSLVTGINGLTLDLCDYVTVSWTRGGGAGPYINSVFRVEAIDLAPLDAKVKLELLWCDDLRATDNLPYILDDETQYLRVDASGGRTCTLTDGSTTVNFSSGDLYADGVALGDILLVRDSTESATAFKRNRTLLIVNINDADTVEVDVSDFGSGGPFTITDWEIQESASTSARASYYGKTCGVLGTFYDATPANRILEG